MRAHRPRASTSGGPRWIRYRSRLCPICLPPATSRIRTFGRAAPSSTTGGRTTTRGSRPGSGSRRTSRCRSTWARSSGLLVFGSPHAHDEPLDDASLSLAKFLTRWLDYEPTRQQTRRELERQTDALEDRTAGLERFNSILRHEVINGMTLIGGRAELPAEDLEGVALEDTETSER